VPIFFFKFEAVPKQTHPKCHEFGGAVVNCWILRDTQTQAEALARSRIDAEEWQITALDEAGPMTRQSQAEYPDGMRYFEQAEIDGEVFVFHTWPVDADE
jgi:hypothetical protein